MVPYDRTDMENLTWIQIDPLKPLFELRSGEQTVAQLSWLKEAGTLAEGALLNQRFTFKRSGFWKPFVTVRKEGTPYDYGKVELSWMHESRLMLPNGISYGWSLRSMWRQEWAFTDPGQTPLVIFKVRMTLKGLQADVTVAQSMRQQGDIPLLILLGWYLIASISLSDGGAETAVLMAAIS